MCIRDRRTGALLHQPALYELSAGGCIVDSRVAVHICPVSYTHLDVYKRQIKNRIIIVFEVILFQDGKPLAGSDYHIAVGRLQLPGKTRVKKSTAT